MNDEAIHPLDDAAAVDALVRALTTPRRLVRFSNFEEWAKELRLSKSKLQVPFIRCTALFRADPTGIPLQTVTAWAAFLAGGELVELRVYCGERGLGELVKAQRAYNTLCSQVVELAKELGIELRGGYWPETEGGLKRA